MFLDTQYFVEVYQTQQYIHSTLDERMPQKHENNEIRCKTNIIQYHFSPTYIVNEKQIPIDRCVLVVREYAESNFAAICRVLMENMNTIFFLCWEHQS